MHSEAEHCYFLFKLEINLAAPRALLDTYKKWKHLQCVDWMWQTVWSFCIFFDRQNNNFHSENRFPWSMRGMPLCCTKTHSRMVSLMNCGDLSTAPMSKSRIHEYINTIYNRDGSPKCFLRSSIFHSPTLHFHACHRTQFYFAPFDIDFIF